MLIPVTLKLPWISTHAHAHNLSPSRLFQHPSFDPSPSLADLTPILCLPALSDGTAAALAIHIHPFIAPPALHKTLTHVPTLGPGHCPSNRDQRDPWRAPDQPIHPLSLSVPAGARPCLQLEPGALATKQSGIA